MHGIKELETITTAIRSINNPYMPLEKACTRLLPLNVAKLVQSPASFTPLLCNSRSNVPHLQQCVLHYDVFVVDRGGNALLGVI
jgi:hypothetical protein